MVSQRRGTSRIRPGRGRRSGFTLIELMVVLAIMVVVFGIATPSILKMVQSTKESRSRTLFRAVLANARSYALANRVYAGYRFSKSPRDGRMYAILIYHNPSIQSDLNNQDNNMRVGVAANQAGVRIRDAARNTPAILAFYAVNKVKPVDFPEGFGLLQDELRTITGPSDQMTNDDLKGDPADWSAQGVSEPIHDAQRFSILFDPRGRPAQILHVVLRRSDEKNIKQVSNKKFDSIFNEYDVVVNKKDALLLMDEPVGGNTIVAERSQVGTIPIQEEELLQFPADQRWVETSNRPGYVQRQPRWLLSTYSGQVIEIPGVGS